MFSRQTHDGLMSSCVAFKFNSYNYYIIAVRDLGQQFGFQADCVYACTGVRSLSILQRHFEASEDTGVPRQRLLSTPMHQVMNPLHHAKSWQATYPPTHLHRFDVLRDQTWTTAQCVSQPWQHVSIEN